ncbi:MAG TPA: cytochrome P450, partial [Solirubrobacteraceae bacterium]|nr:cytochrome P450 [Solirubrobacteraceae bacterium]
YIVTDREAGEFFLRTREASFPGMKIAEIFGVSEGPLWEQMRRNILNVNGVDHARLRSLVNPALSPRAVERYRPVMRGFLEELLAGAREATGESATGSSGASVGTGGVEPAVAGEGTVRCEFVEAFAKPYPSRVIASVMGAPVEDAPRLHHWSNWIQKQFDAASMAGEREGIERAVEEFYAYAGALVEARRDDPGDDLISTLIAAADPAHQPERLGDVECINLVFNVLAGGVDTTQSQLAHTVRLLAEHPGQWALLRNDPTLAERAVEEALRYEPITPFTARIVDEELTFRDVTFPVGTIVMVCAFTANRDLEGGEEEGEAFDITAGRGGARALTFGAGVHYCLGANLAKLELGEALAFLAERFTGLELDGEPEFESIMGIYGLGKLPVRLLA